MSRYALILAPSAAAILIVLAVSQARGDSMAGETDLAPDAADPRSVCTASRSLGGLTSCKSALLWHEYANQDCIVRGYPKVGAIDYDGACWKGFRSVEYTCCN